MTKDAYFDRFYGPGWPTLEFLEPYFVKSPAPHGWFHNSGNDSAVIHLFGLEGTEHLPQWKGRKDISLSMWGHPKLGVLLQYSRVGWGMSEDWFSAGDLSKFGLWVRTLHGDPMPVGLYIPFSKAWLAVREFMETEGRLPKSIEWISSNDVPDGTFPDPMDVDESKVLPDP